MKVVGKSAGCCEFGKKNRPIASEDIMHSRPADVFHFEKIIISSPDAKSLFTINSEWEIRARFKDTILRSRYMIQYDVRLGTIPCLKTRPVVSASTTGCNRGLGTACLDCKYSQYVGVLCCCTYTAACATRLSNLNISVFTL